MKPEEMEALKVPAELRGEQVFLDAPDVGTVFKIARDNMVAARAGIRVPGPDAGEADKKDFTEKLKKAAPHLVELPSDPEKREAALLDHLGIPKEAKEYEPPKEHGLSEAALEALRAEAKAEGLTKKQFERRVERAKAESAKAAQARSEALASLKKEIGPAAFEERLQAAAAAAKKNGEDDSTVIAIMKGEAPVSQIKSYINFAKALGTEPGDLGGIEGGPKGALTKDEARSRLQEVYRNPAFMDKNHPEHRALVEKQVEYNRIIHS